MQISGHEAGGNAAATQCRYHQHGEIAATAAAEIERADGRLDTLLVPRRVLEGPPDGPRHVAEQRVGVGRAVVAEERGAPAIDGGMRRQWRDEGLEAGPIFRRVGKRKSAGKVRYIGGAKFGRRSEETNVADKAKLASPVVEMSGRHVIAEAVPRPSQLFRFWRDFEFRCKHLLIVVVAWPQHHPVLAECDWSIIMISRNVSDVANRHCRPKIMDAPATSIAAAILSTTCMFWARYCACLLCEPPNRKGSYLSKQIWLTETRSAFDSAFSGWDFFGKNQAKSKPDFDLVPRRGLEPPRLVSAST